MKNLLILNIGLAIPGEAVNQLLPGDVIKSLLHGFEIFDLRERVLFKVVESNTEPTLVICGSLSADALGASHWHTDYLRSVIHDIADHHRQDAIAWRTLNEELRQDRCGVDGPRAEAWGEFNPEFFINP